MDYARLAKIKHLIKLARAILELAKIEEDVEQLKKLKQVAFEAIGLFDDIPIFDPDLGPDLAFDLHEFVTFRIDIFRDIAEGTSPDIAKMKATEYAAEIDEMLKGHTAFIKKLEPQLAQPITEDDSTIHG